MRRAGSYVVVVCGVILVTTVSVSAQPPPRPERPYRGLFRGGAVGGASEQSLTLDAEVGGGYDDNVFTEGFSGGAIPPADTWQSGNYAYMAADLAYSLSTPRVSFGASLETTNRYFPDQATNFIGAHAGRIGVLFERRRSQLTLGQSISYQPFLTFNVFPTVFDPELGQGDVPDINQGTPLDAYVSSLSNVDWTYRTSRRGALVFGYSYRRSMFEDEDFDLAVHTANGRYEHEVLRDLSVRFGYGYAEGRYPASPTVAEDKVRQHTIDVGVNFERALSLTRRTTFGFETGGAAITDSDQTYYRVLGEARLNHELLRSWNVGISYMRNLSFVEAIADPYFSDALSIGVRGMLNRRLELDASADASTGNIGVTRGSEDNGLTSYGSRIELTYGLTRFLALQFSHFYYHYAFGSDVTLPETLASAYDRQSALVTLNVWLPLIASVRRTNASR